MRCKSRRLYDVAARMPNATMAIPVVPGSGALEENAKLTGPFSPVDAKTELLPDGVKTSTLLEPKFAT